MFKYYNFLPGDKNYNSLSRIVDFFTGYIDYISVLVDHLAYFGMKNEAFGIMKRHNVETMTNNNTKEALKEFEYS